MPTLALALLALASAQQPPDFTDFTPGGLVWSTPGARPLFALSDRGGQLVAGLLDDSFHLYSSFDSDPPTAFWSSSSIEASFWNLPLAAAAESDVYLLPHTRTDWATFTAGTVRKFRSRSTVAEWRFEFPRQFFSIPLVDLSRDGETIVSCFSKDWPSRVELRLHDAATGQALQTLLGPTPSYASRFDLSPDGSVAVFSYDTGLGSTDVYDITNGAHLGRLVGDIFGDQAISESGSMIATFDGTTSLGYRVRVHERIAGGYQQILVLPMPVGVEPSDLAVSDDGSTLAAGWRDGRSPRQGIVRAYDLDSGAMTMEHVDSSNGDIIPASIAIAADGSRFVVGLKGIGSIAYPELAVYSPASSAPLRAHEAGGAVHAVDLSPDGKRYAAARAPGNGTFTSTSIELYEFGGEDLRVRGTPSVGATIQFELHGAPGASARLLRATALAPSPIPVPGAGLLHLDPATIAAIPIGTVPPNGVAVHSMVATTFPGMIGRTAWYQGLTVHPRQLTEDYVQLTIVP